MKNNDELKYYYLKGLKFPFQASKLIYLTLICWAGMVSVLLVSTLFFGYELTNADIPCGSLAGCLLAYLIFVTTVDDNE